MKDDSQQLSRSFKWLNLAQFFGALNDNVFRFLIVFCIINLKGADAERYVPAVALAVFVVPFLAFAALAGVMADRLSKKRIIVFCKLLELVIMVLGMFAFMAGSDLGLYAILFIMAFQSTMFGPAKYGVVPELVAKHQLSRANGYLAAMTYLAIIIGTGLAAIIPIWLNNDYWMASVFCVCIAVVGLVASIPIEHTPPAGSERQASLFFLGDIFRTLAYVRKDRDLFAVVLASAYFMLLGAFVQTNIIPYGIQALGLDEKQSGLLFPLAAIGIGIGALLAGKLSGRNVEFGIVPIGALGLTLSTGLLAVTPGSLPLICFLIAMVGLFAGLFIVPLNAFIQFRSPRRQLGEILAASSFLSWTGALLASFLVLALSQLLGLSARQGFLFISILTLVLTILAFRQLPDFVIRFVGLLITRIFYRLRVIGNEHLPVEGGAVLVSNHVSWVDALLINAVQQRRIRFLMWRRVYLNKWLHPVFRMMGIIPIAYDDSPKLIVKALKAAREELDKGFLVCVFAEGRLTRDGSVNEFRSGFERIVRDTEHPIIPVYLGGVWGSIFSYYDGKLLGHMPRKIPYPVTISFGDHMPPSAKAKEVREAVLELAAAAHGTAAPACETARKT